MYKSNTYTQRITQDIEGVKSNCQKIFFYNQGETNAKIYLNNEDNYVLLAPNTGFGISHENPLIQEQSTVKINFDSGSGDLSILKTQVQLITP